MSERQRRGRDERLVDQAYRADGLIQFVEHPDVTSFFDIYERGCVNEIASADPSDDETRRNSGLKLQAMRALKKHMEDIIAAGANAKTRLAAIEEKEEHERLTKPEVTNG